jgi:hypothetical protein
MGKDLLVTALSEFEKAYAQWCTAYGEKHLQARILKVLLRLLLLMCSTERNTCRLAH